MDSEDHKADKIEVKDRGWEQKGRGKREERNKEKIK